MFLVYSRRPHKVGPINSLTHDTTHRFPVRLACYTFFLLAIAWLSFRPQSDRSRATDFQNVVFFPFATALRAIPMMMDRECLVSKGHVFMTIASSAFIAAL